jgi:hypothetical protein
MRGFLPAIFGAMNVKEDGDGTSAAGTSTSFDADVPHDDAIQSIDLNALITGTTAADLGRTLHFELLKAIEPVKYYNMYAVPEISIPTEVFNQYTYFLDAALDNNYLLSYDVRRDTLTKSVAHATYGMSYTLVNAGRGEFFPQSGGPPATQYNCLITAPGALKFAFNPYSTGYAASWGQTSTLSSLVDNPEQYITQVEQALASNRGNYNFLRAISANDTNPGILSMMQQGNFGNNSILNILSGVIAKLQYGTADAMHYHLEVAAQSAVLRDNPALIRKWVVPFAKAVAPSSYSKTTAPLSKNMRKGTYAASTGVSQSSMSMAGA